ncbi:unnamed protein product, partial [marine sediment metagenome]
MIEASVIILLQFKLIAVRFIKSLTVSSVITKFQHKLRE